MKKYVIFLLAIIISHSVFARKPYNVQFTVWNMTSQPIVLHCNLLKDHSTLFPQQPFTIMPDVSPALLLTFPNFGKLIHCWLEQQPAWFDYSVWSLDEESMEISPLSQQPNFHYDSSYPGALTYW